MVGIYSWPNGSVYEGEVKNGLRHGNGTYKCVIHPSIYIGEWVNGARHGRGILYFDENYETYYDGDWKDGIKHGHGVLKYASGNIYEGQWYQNLRHGKGESKITILFYVSTTLLHFTLLFINRILMVIPTWCSTSCCYC